MRAGQLLRRICISLPQRIRKLGENGPEYARSKVLGNPLLVLSRFGQCKLMKGTPLAIPTLCQKRCAVEQAEKELEAMQRIGPFDCVALRPPDAEQCTDVQFQEVLGA